MLHAWTVAMVAQAGRHMTFCAQNALNCSFPSRVDPAGWRRAAAPQPAAAAAKLPVGMIHKSIWNLTGNSARELVDDVRLQRNPAKRVFRGGNSDSQAHRSVCDWKAERRRPLSGGWKLFGCSKVGLVSDFLEPGKV